MGFWHSRLEKLSCNYVYQTQKHIKTNNISQVSLPQDYASKKEQVYLSKN